MTLQELTAKLQSLCHDGHSLDEVFIGIDRKNYSDIIISNYRCEEKKEWLTLKATKK